MFTVSVRINGKLKRKFSTPAGSIAEAIAAGEAWAAEHGFTGVTVTAKPW